MNDETKIKTYFKQHEKFSDLLEELRRIVKLQPFEETVKWGIPTYTYQNKNLISIGAFKNHVGLWFFQGALLKDKYKVLHNAQEGKTKALRQIHFKKINEIDEALLQQYLQETIKNQKDGLVIERAKSNTSAELPVELSNFLEANPETLEKFSQLSPGRRREYAKFISEAKREKTKIARLDKIKPLILKGIGMNDKYKNC